MNTQNQHTSPLYSDILNRLEGVRRKENRVAVEHAILITFLAILGVLALVVIVERVFFLGTTGRTILFSSLLTGAAAAFALFAARPLLRTLRILKSDSNETVANHVGRFFPQIRDRLLDALQMYEQRDALRGNYSLDLIDASFLDLYNSIQGLDFRESVSNIKVRAMGKLASYAFGIAVLMFIISPLGLFTSMSRIFNFNVSFASPSPIRFIVEPGNTEIVRGQDLSVTIKTEGKPLQSINLRTRQAGQLDFDSQTLTLNQSGVFQTEISHLKTSTEYYASAEDVNSDKYTIKVLDRPLIRTFQIKITSPRYTHIPVKMLDENMGDINAYPGSVVDMEVTSSKAITSAQAIFANKPPLTLTCSAEHISGSFIVRENTSYHLLLKDKDGLTSADPLEYSVKIIPDEYPSVEILSPGKNIDMTGEMRLILSLQIKDDFGFSGLRLAYRLAHSRYEEAAKEFTYAQIPFSHIGPITQNIVYAWDLTGMSLVPEDAVEYYAEVFDNDNVSGPKSGKSSTFLIRLPSLEEVFSEVDQSHDQSVQSMQDVSKESQQLKKDIEEVQRDLQKNKEKMDWQQKKKVEDMVQRYDSMKQKLDQTAQKMDDMMKQMQDNKLLSNETMEKYTEMQKLMEQLNSPELQQALKKLQEMMKNQQQLSPEQMKQAMEQLKTSEEQFRNNLERTIELLKRIHIEQKLDELVKRTEELKKQQENLRDEASKTNPADQQKRSDLAKKQGDMQKDLESLEKETADLKNSMEEFAKEMPLEQMSKAQQQLSQQQLGKKMQTSAQKIESGDMQQAQQSQNQTEQGLQNFEDQLQTAQKTLQDKQMKEIVQKMKKQLDDVLELSKREEDMKDETKGLDANSQRFRESTEKQNQTMNDLGNVANSMTDLSKKTFAVSPDMAKEIGNALQNMGQAMKELENRNPMAASQPQGEAMGSLNRAAMMMQSTLTTMEQAGQKGGMGMAGLMGALGQMMGQQSGINQGTMSAMGMGGQGQGEGQSQTLSAQQQAEYQRLSGQQGAVRKNLEKLAEEAKNSQEYSKLLGDLDDIAKQMSEVESDLSQGNVNPETIQKQDRILSRLLDSQRSTRERDYEKRRKAEAGKTPAHASPGEIDLSTQEGKDKLRQEMLKVLEGKYSKDYQELIRKYFEVLEKEEINQ
ncbi:MAG: DUF4175 family protein [Bacteroidota bacterium]